MTVADLIAKLQQHDPEAVVVLRGLDYTADVPRARALTPLKLRAFAAEGCGWFEYWDDAEATPDDRTTVFAEPVHGLLLE